MLYNLAYPMLFAGAKTTQLASRARTKTGLVNRKTGKIVYTPETLYRVTCWRLRRIDVHCAMLFSPSKAARLSVERFETIRQGTVRPSALDAELAYDEKAVINGDNTIYVRQYGSTDLPQVLVLHGWNGNAGMLAEQVKALMDQGFGVVVPDLPGHGKSTGSRFSFYDLGMIIADVFRRTDFKAVIGHSAGGLLALLALYNGLKAERFIPIGSPSSLEAILKSYVDVTQMPARSYRYIQRYYNDRYLMDPVEVGAATLANMDVKTLIIHEQRDWQVVVSNAHALADAAKNGELFLTTGRTHLNILKAPEVHEKIVSFLNEEIATC